MVTTYLTDPAWRAPVYRAVAEHLRGNHTVGTGLIVKGLALPEMKVELDLEAVIRDRPPPEVPADELPGLVRRDRTQSR